MVAMSPEPAVLSLLDDRLPYLVALPRDTPQPPPALSLDEWREFRDLLRPHGVYPLLAYRLHSKPEDCRPSIEVMELPMPPHRRASGAPAW